MADPLATLAEREVPEPTNYFDPAAAQTVISRYASARRRATDSELVAKAESDALDRRGQTLRIQEDESKLARDAVMQGREDLDYQARKDALRQRGDFIRKMGQTLDPKSPEYNRQVTEFMSGLPQELADDDTIKSVIQSMNAEADDYRSRANTAAGIDKRTGAKMEFITNEDYAANQRADGNGPNMEALTAINAERGRAYKEKTFKDRLNQIESKQVRLMDRKAMSKPAQKRDTEVEDWIFKDREAFPSRIDTVKQEYLKANPDNKSADPAILETNPKWRDKYAEALAWDKDLKKNELSAAYSYEDPEEYVKLAGDGISEEKKARRLATWKHAHRDAFDEGDAPEPATPSAPAAKKKLTPEVIADLKKRAGGDPVKAKQLALDEGY